MIYQGGCYNTTLADISQHTQSCAFFFLDICLDSVHFTKNALRASVLHR